MRIGFVGGTYTTAFTAEECINWLLETTESQGAISPERAYGGQTAGTNRGLIGTPGLSLFTTMPETPVRGLGTAGGRKFAVGGTKLYEVASAGTLTQRGAIANDSKPVSIVASSIQMLIVSAGKAYCYTLATDSLLDVTSSLVGVPVKCEVADDYFIVQLEGDKFQMSGILDGLTWSGIRVNQVSKFPEDIVSIIINHGELWVFGSEHAVVYQDTGSLEILDPIPGTLIETGCAATFAPCRVDNSVFWISEDERGGRMAHRSNGYTPQRISTHAVEADLSTYADISGLVSYSYQDGGHTFWVLYIPGSQWSWTFDVSESVWHKRASWNSVSSTWGPHWSWNHLYAFGKHLVGDWNTGNIYELSMANLDDNGTTVRRQRRAPTVINEMEWVAHAELTAQFKNGQTSNLVDGDGFQRAPQAMLRWSDDNGQTWSNEHVVDCGLPGEFNARSIWRRLGRARYRVYELTVSDPIQWVLLDAFLRTA